MKRNIDAQDIEKNKLLAALSYLCILFVLYWLVDSQFVKFHARHSLVIFVFEIALLILGILAHDLIPMWGLISFVLRLLFLAARVIGFIYALQGKVEPVPVVGNIADSFKL